MLKKTNILTFWKDNWMSKLVDFSSYTLGMSITTICVTRWRQTRTYLSHIHKQLLPVALAETYVCPFRECFLSAYNSVRLNQHATFHFSPVILATSNFFIFCHFLIQTQLLSLFTCRNEQLLMCAPVMLRKKEALNQCRFFHVMFV